MDVEGYRIGQEEPAPAEASEGLPAEPRFERLLQAAPVAIVIADVDGRIMFTNDRARRLFGFEGKELAGRSIGKLIPDLLGTIVSRRWGAGASGDDEMRLELIGRRSDGSELSVEVAVGLAETQAGVLVSSAIHDLSARREMERRLIDQAAALAYCHAELEKFADVASHDLQEPLRKISTFCFLLKDAYGGRLDETADVYIGYVVDGALRLQALVKDLLELADKSRSDITEAVNLRSIVDSALLSLSTTCEEADATIEIGELPVIEGERSRLIRLYRNLVSNSVKFRSSDRACQIQIGARKDGRSWLFWVRDNGIGIDPQYQDEVFEIFRRLHSRESYAGTGLGLPMCRLIVQRLGGRMWVESAADLGSTFYWTLPI